MMMMPMKDARLYSKKNKVSDRKIKSAPIKSVFTKLLIDLTINQPIFYKNTHRIFPKYKSILDP